MVTIGWVTGLFMIPAGFVKSDHWTVLFCIFGAALVGLSTGNLLAILQMLCAPGKGRHMDGSQELLGEPGRNSAPLVMGYLLKQTGSYGYGFAVGAVIFILGLIPYWFVVQELKPPGERTTA